LRNAVVRKLSIADLTTTVLTLTITGLAADSSLAGGENPRWQRRFTAVVTMLAGAFAGGILLRYSMALPLFIAGVISAVGAIAAFHIQSKGMPNLSAR